MTTPKRHRIHIVRHGETTWNETGRLNSSTDNPLSSRGTEQVNALADSIQGWLPKLDAVYTSPSLRSVETAKILSSRLNVATKPIIEPLLQEVDFGRFEGQRPVDILSAGHESKNEFSRWREGGDSDHAESFTKASRRAAKFLKKVQSAEDILVVSHGYFSRILIARQVLRMPISAVRRIWIENAAISTIEFDPETAKYQLVSLNLHGRPLK